MCILLYISSSIKNRRAIRRLRSAARPAPLPLPSFFLSAPPSLGLAPPPAQFLFPFSFHRSLSFQMLFPRRSRALFSPRAPPSIQSCRGRVPVAGSPTLRDATRPAAAVHPQPRSRPPRSPRATGRLPPCLPGCVLGRRRSPLPCYVGRRPPRAPLPPAARPVAAAGWPPRPTPRPRARPLQPLPDADRRAADLPTRRGTPRPTLRPRTRFRKS